ncbi:MAG TPA: pyridoxamine 5'-phosphate oxidase family protein [Longimicrobium sp.]|jgi:hypothetical protein
MGKVVECITPELKTFIEAQPLFFVATAPLAGDGHVNLSPKGLDCLRVLSPTRVAYLDLTGSGNETAAHLHENRRITFIFCAFAGPPRILRLYGSGEVILPDTDEWTELSSGFPAYPGIRHIVRAEISRVQTSCGFAVPLMQYSAQRDTLLRWAEAKGDALPAYQREKNTRSIDGLPAPVAAHVSRTP